MMKSPRLRLAAPGEGCPPKPRATGAKEDMIPADSAALREALGIGKIPVIFLVVHHSVSREEIFPAFLTAWD